MQRRGLADNGHGQCLPELEPGASHAQVAVGKSHRVLMRSDGRAVTCGRNVRGQYGLPELGPGARYTDVTASGAHTVLLRSDGRAMACGKNVDATSAAVLRSNMWVKNQVARFHRVSRPTSTHHSAT